MHRDIAKQRNEKERLVFDCIKPKQIGGKKNGEGKV
jgi:hypothetical protein